MTHSHNSTADPTAQEADDGLEEGHRSHLADSAISPEVIYEREYTSAYGRDILRQYGFPTGPIGGLLIPIHTVHGTIAYYQYRPDDPETDRNGVVKKYRFPYGVRKVIDVHPCIRERVADLTVDLWITEGIKKADAAISHGLCCIALMDVWAFATKGAYDESEPLEDWESIPLKGRKVYVAFDSDVMTNPKVAKALRQFSAFLKEAGAV